MAQIPGFRVTAATRNGRSAMPPIAVTGLVTRDSMPASHRIPGFAVSGTDRGHRATTHLIASPLMTGIAQPAVTGYFRSAIVGMAPLGMGAFGMEALALWMPPPAPPQPPAGAERWKLSAYAREQWEASSAWDGREWVPIVQISWRTAADAAAGDPLRLGCVATRPMSIYDDGEPQLSMAGCSQIPVRGGLLRGPTIERSLPDTGYGMCSSEIGEVIIADQDGQWADLFGAQIYHVAVGLAHVDRGVAVEIEWLSATYGAACEALPDGMLRVRMSTAGTGLSVPYAEIVRRGNVAELKQSENGNTVPLVLGRQEQVGIQPKAAASLSYYVASPMYASAPDITAVYNRGVSVAFTPSNDGSVTLAAAPAPGSLVATVNDDLGPLGACASLAEAAGYWAGADDEPAESLRANLILTDDTVVADAMHSALAGACCYARPSALVDYRACLPGVTLHRGWDHSYITANGMVQNQHPVRTGLECDTAAPAVSIPLRLILSGSWSIGSQTPARTSVTVNLGRMHTQITDPAGSVAETWARRTYQTVRESGTVTPLVQASAVLDAGAVSNDTDILIVMDPTVLASAYQSEGARVATVAAVGPVPMLDALLGRAVAISPESWVPTTIPQLSPPRVVGRVIRQRIDLATGITELDMITTAWSA